MKRMIICMMTLLILLSGCSNTAEKNKNLCLEKAVEYAVTYLNAERGYDISAEYSLKCYLKAAKEWYPQSYKLTENGKELLWFVIEESDGEIAAGGVLYFTYNGKDLKLYPVFSSDDLNDFKTEVTAVNVNEHLYLEDAQVADLDGKYTLTDKAHLDTIREYLRSNAILFEVKEGDEVAIYEHLNIIRLEYDKDSKKIVSVENSHLHYPMAINGEVVKLIAFTPDLSLSSGSIDVDDGEPWKKYIEDETAFILASATPFQSSRGIVFKANEDDSVTAPVIIKKAYQQLKALAAKQEPYQLLFKFIYHENGS